MYPLDVSRFDEEDPDSAAMKEKRAARERKRREQQEEQNRLKEGLKKGEFRPVDPNETVNEVPSNWGAAMAMAAAREGDKYFAAPGAKGKESDESKEPKESKESKEPKESKEKKDAQKFRPANDAETVNEVVSNWGAAQAMLQKREGGATPLGSSKEKKEGIPPKPPAPPVIKQKFRPANDAETINEVVSNWGAAQAMLQKRETKVPAPPPQGSSKDRKPAISPRAPPRQQQKFRPADDNETVNEVVSNWGAAQAMLQKREGGNVPPPLPQGSSKDRKPAVPPRAPARPQQKFRPADDNETVNEVVSNWGAAQAMLQKRAIPTPPPKPKPKPQPEPPRGMRKADDFETINECVSNWGAVQALAKKKGL